MSAVKYTTVCCFCLICQFFCSYSRIRVPTTPGKSWILFVKNFRTWKVLENHFGPGKAWKLKVKVLESPGKISLNVMHFSSASNGTQAALV